MLSACGNDPAPGPEDPAAQAACEALLADAPGLLGGAERRDSGAGPYAGTWGAQPSIVVRCGVPEPPGLEPTSECIDADGVDWFAPEEQAADQSLDATLTTVGREPRVQVVVPAQRRPPNDVLVELAPAVLERTAETTRCR